jgi:hypothetical protein
MALDEHPFFTLKTFALLPGKSRDKIKGLNCFFNDLIPLGVGLQGFEPWAR